MEYTDNLKFVDKINEIWEKIPLTQFNLHKIKDYPSRNVEKLASGERGLFSIITDDNRLIVCEIEDDDIKFLKDDEE